MKPTKLYTDINLNFIPHPLTGDVTIISDDEAIKTSLYNLASYKKGEMFMLPNDYSGIQELLFEPNAVSTKLSIRNRLKNFIERKEPRIKVQEIYVKNENDAYTIDVLYKNVNSEEEKNATIYLKRVR